MKERKLNLQHILAGTFVCLTTSWGVASGNPFDNAGWPRYSYDYSNSNHNPLEILISPKTAPNLRRTWATFNDDQWRPGVPPSGFALEGALGLSFPATVVGVVSPPLVVDNTLYYVDALGTLFARDARTGAITDSNAHWTTTLVDPDYAS